ncbi:MAG: Gx transporter family protein [Lachnospiraceae bacterium]|jgi:heptaprenyl diphosphate synthase
MRKNRAKTVALYGVLIALAMVLSWVEAQIPAFFAVPGMKLGLTNIAVIVALYCMDEKSAVIISLVRIVLVSFLFGSGVSLIYSLAGGILSITVMIILKRAVKLKMVTVSIAGGIAHNVGQVITAVIMLQTTSLAWYLLILWFSGIAAGTVIGLIGAELTKRLRRFIENNY